MIDININMILIINWRFLTSFGMTGSFLESTGRSCDSFMNNDKLKRTLMNRHFFLCIYINELSFRMNPPVAELVEARRMNEESPRGIHRGLPLKKDVVIGIRQRRGGTILIACPVLREALRIISDSLLIISDINLKNLKP